MKYDLTVLLAFGMAVSYATSARSQGMGSGTLADLMTPREGKVRHFASADPKGGNDDFRAVAPGETITLLDYKGGAGVVRRWWVTIAPRNNVFIQRQAIVRCYWDGETSPSVECPISDFFGMGFGEWRDYQSLPLNMTSGGYNCYWPMPFHRSARITVENRSKVRIDALYYNLDVETQSKIPHKTLYFHAQFRRARPTTPGKSYTILETTGKGQYVGSLMSMQPMKGRSLGYLEGDEQVTVDGEAVPSIIGTGTEDYFSSGWYFDTGVYSAPYHGVTIKDTEKGRINAYRWHIEDAIPFDKSLRFAIEHGPVNDIAGDYSSVAFYYQTHPHPPFPPLPPDADLLPVEPTLPPRFPGIIEGESLRSGAQATSGAVELQDMDAFDGSWSGGAQLWWKPEQAGARLMFTVNAPKAGTYELIGHFTRAPDYGDFRVLVSGAWLTPTVSGYSERVQPSGPVSLGRVALVAGANPVTVEITGKNARSADYLAGIDGFVLKP